jgi:hypothetical protein
MIVLDQPTTPIPLHMLPGLFQGRRGNRGQQNPFQRLFSRWSGFFPDANDPNRQRFFAGTWLIARWQECHPTKGKLQLRRTSLASMTSGNLERAIGLTQQTIQRLTLFPGLHLSWQRTQRILCQFTGRLYCASRATHIMQLDPSKGSLGPDLWVQHVLCIHPCILSLCKMWVRISREKRGVRGLCIFLNPSHFCVMNDIRGSNTNE